MISLITLAVAGIWFLKVCFEGFVILEGNQGMSSPKLKFCKVMMDEPVQSIFESKLFFGKNFLIYTIYLLYKKVCFQPS